MPGKVQAYVEMANETAASITQDAEAWIPPHNAYTTTFLF